MPKGRWSVEHVLSLAPDPSSAKAARRLGSPRTWSQLGATSTLVWGRCQGSGKEPYHVTIDLTGPAFKCSCPSRKFPCKHGLALLLMWAAGDGSVAGASDPAQFASDWGDRRAEGATTVAREPPSTEPVDAEAQARRLARRIDTMSAGIDDFERWLFDIVRQGLVATRRQPFSFWDSAAARLVDAQLPGLADRVRTAGGAVHARSDWAEHLLGELCRWYLAVRGWRRRDEFDAALVADLRVVLGWGRRADEVVALNDRLTDRWQVVGRRLGDDGRLQSQRTWLVGERSGELAMLLDFAAAGAALPVAQVVGTVIEGDVCFYPGSQPRRALLVEGSHVVGTAPAVPGAAPIDDNLDAVATRLAANPWAVRFPMAVAGAVAVVEDEGTVAVIDTTRRRLPLGPEADPWPLLALTGGRPADLFGEWEDGHLYPMSVAVDGELAAV